MAKFQLTDTPDNLTGGAAGDVFRGDIGTLQTADTIDGGAGRDLVNASTARNGPQAPTITDVETLRLQTGGLPFDIENVTGAEVIRTFQDDIIIQSIGTEDLGIRFAARDVQSGTVKLQFADGALSGMNDRLELQSDGSNLTFTSDSTFDATADGEMNATEDRLRVEEIQLTLSGTDPDAQFANQVDLSSFAAIDTLRIRDDGMTGPGKVTVGSTDLETINALGTSGGITLTSDIGGDQVVFGGSGDDDLKTGGGDDTIIGGDGDDVLTAGAGANAVNGGAGDDEITSEQDDDRIIGGAGDDTISSGSGIDRINGGDGADEIKAGDGADRVFGDAGNDTIMGQGGADVIFDGAGNDMLMGGGDNDSFLVGTGDDTFLGGGGEDLFFFYGESGGTNTIEDFTLTSTTATNDRVRFDFQGTTQNLRSQDEFEAFFDANQGPRVQLDNATSTLTIESDNGTIVLQASDTDFLLS